MTAVLQEPASPWLVGGAKDPGRVRMRLFCFHYAGATASIFRSWQDALPETVEVLAVQLPGREYRFSEPLLTDSKQIAAALVEDMLPLLGKPFVFFGHSMGVLIGFDVIQILRARGLPQPELLIASGRNAPPFRWRDAGLQTLPDDEFIATVRDYSGTPESLLAEESLRELWLPRLRADLTVSALYEYAEQRPLECPIVVLIGEKDDLVTEAGLQGWLTETTGGVQFFHYPGNHFFLHSVEELVLAKVRTELEEQLARQKHSRRQA
ncbi:thioesterase II family protein [Arenibaculum sp.]|jgi:surfactin synthase thioesterase subunit|uniref:thioesterase II family protein n=1 Tax=Arenibaculum sp. TaxID=2865862 RepID=UPI002E0EC5EA|nr:alpha/beta fold hydrolase [Arenibaculum sp.]